MDVNEVVAAARREDVRLIRFEYCDASGVARSKAIHVDQLAHKLVEGVSLTRAQMAINVLEQLVDIEGMAPVGEIRLLPDPATFSVLPWARGSASVQLSGRGSAPRPPWRCPRPPGACSRSPRWRR
jgi:glutamine synthetase